MHQQGTIYNAYKQSFPVVDLDVTDDGHLSGFANFHGGNLRPDGFPVGQKFSVITDDPRSGIVTDSIHLTIKFVHPQTAQVSGHVDGSRAQFQNVNTVANVQAELDERFARMAIEEAKKSTPEDSQPRPKVGAVLSEAKGPCNSVAASKMQTWVLRSAQDANCAWCRELNVTETTQYEHARTQQLRA
jgi:hypothetical protein